MFILCWSNHILADKIKNQPLYLNILDLDGSFETNLLSTYNNIIYKKSSLTLEKNFYNANLSYTLYNLIVEYNTPDNTISIDQTTKKEIYILRIFNSTTIIKDNIQFYIESNPIYTNYFSSYLYTKITDTTNQKNVKEGMIPFLNKQHLTLLKDYNHENFQEISITDSHKLSLDAMNQLINMASSVTNQLKLHSSITNSNILNSFVEKGITLLEIPDDTLFNAMLNDNDNNINKILNFMYTITNTVEFLHEKNIALGSISLTNLFMLKNNVVLSGFEHFNSLNNKENSLNLQKNIFYRSSYQFEYAPEICFPLPNHRFYLKNITIASDIYSLGMLFAEILYIFASSQFDLTKLVSSDQVFYCVETHKKELVYFNRYPYQFIQKIKYQTPVVLSDMHYSIKNFLGYYFQSQKEECSDIINKLINIINLCQEKSPENRLTATQVKDMLLDVIKKSDCTYTQST